MRIGLSAVVVVVLAAFPVPATKDLISNNGQYKQQEERTILISPPHAMPFPCPCLSSSLSPSQQGATDKVGKWSLDSAEWRGRGREGEREREREREREGERERERGGRERERECGALLLAKSME